MSESKSKHEHRSKHEKKEKHGKSEKSKSDTQNDEIEITERPAWANEPMPIITDPIQEDFMHEIDPSTVGE